MSTKKTEYDHAQEILPGIFLGNVIAANDVMFLLTNKITHILDIGKNTPLSKRYLNLIYHDVDVHDTIDEPISEHFDTLIVWIHNSSQPPNKCLVHCAMGISRSVTIMCAYLIQKFKISYETAIKKIQDIRENAKPNIGFQKQLQTFATSLGIVHQEQQQEKKEEPQHERKNVIDIDLECFQWL